MVCTTGTITSSDIARLNANVDAVNDWAEGGAAFVATMASGLKVPSPLKVITDARLFKAPTAFSAAVTYTDATQPVTESGTVFAPLPDSLPIGPAAFNSAEWYVLQGVTEQEVAVQSITTHNMASDADYTLTNAQFVNAVVRILDSGVLLTAARNIIVPDAAREWTVDNQTTQTLTFKTLAGTGVEVFAGFTSQVYSDGTNVKPQFTPQTHATVAAAKAATEPLGSIVLTVENTAGNGGGAKYLIKTVAEAAADGDVVDGFGSHTRDDGNILALQIEGAVTLKQYGGVADFIPSTQAGTDSTAAAQAWWDFCLAKHKSGFAPAGIYRVDRLDIDTDWNWNGSTHTGPSLYTAMHIFGESNQDSLAFTGENGIKDTSEFTVFYSTTSTGTPFRTNITVTGDIAYIFDVPTNLIIEGITFVADRAGFVMEVGMNNRGHLLNCTILNEDNLTGSGVFLKNSFFSTLQNCLIRTADREFFTVSTGIGVKYQNRIATAGITEFNNLLIEGFKIGIVVDGNGDQGAIPLNGSGIDNIKLRRLGLQRCQYGIVARTTRSNLFTLDIDGCFFERIKYTGIDISGNLEQGSIEHCKFPLQAFTRPVGLTIDSIDTAGAITGAVVNAGGTDYSIGDTVDLAGGGGDCVLTVATVTGKGVIATVSITAAGSGYTGATGVATVYKPVNFGVIVGDGTDKWGQATGSGEEAETASATTYTASGVRSLSIKQNFFFVDGKNVGVFVENNALGLTVSDNDLHAVGTPTSESFGIDYNGRAGSSDQIVEMNNRYIGDWSTGSPTRTTAAADADVFMEAVAGRSVLFKTVEVLGDSTVGGSTQTKNIALTDTIAITADTFGETTQLIVADATSGVITVSLATAATSEGKEYSIVKTDSSVNVVRFQRNGADSGVVFVRGSGSGTSTALASISGQFDSMTIKCIQGQWWVTAANGTVIYA